MMKLFEINKNTELFEILKDDELHKIVHLSLKKGKTVSRHHSDYIAIVVCLRGEISFTNYQETYSLINGQFLVLEVKEEHELTAIQDSEILVIQQK